MMEEVAAFFDSRRRIPAEIGGAFFSCLRRLCARRGMGPFRAFPRIRFPRDKK